MKTLFDETSVSWNVHSMRRSFDETPIQWNVHSMNVHSMKRSFDETSFDETSFDEKGRSFIIVSYGKLQELKSTINIILP